MSTLRQWDEAKPLRVDFAAVGLEVAIQNQSTDGAVTAQSTIHNLDHNKSGRGPILSFSSPYVCQQPTPTQSILRNVRLPVRETRTHGLHPIRAIRNRTHWLR